MTLNLTTIYLKTMDFGRLFVTSRAEALQHIHLHADYTYGDGWTLLHQCARDGDVTSMNTIIDILCSQGKIDYIVRVCLEDPTKSPIKSPTDIAAECGNLEIYYLLLSFPEVGEKIVFRDLKLIESRHSVTASIFKLLRISQSSPDDGIENNVKSRIIRNIMEKWLEIVVRPETVERYAAYLSQPTRTNKQGTWSNPTYLQRILQDGEDSGSIWYTITKMTIQSGCVEAVKCIEQTEPGKKSLRCHDFVSVELPSTPEMMHYLFRTTNGVFFRGKYLHPHPQSAVVSNYIRNCGTYFTGDPRQHNISSLEIACAYDLYGNITITDEKWNESVFDKPYALLEAIEQHNPQAVELLVACGAARNLDDIPCSSFQARQCYCVKYGSSSRLAHRLGFLKINGYSAFPYFYIMMMAGSYTDHIHKVVTGPIPLPVDGCNEFYHYRDFTYWDVYRQKVIEFYRKLTLFDILFFEYQMQTIRDRVRSHLLVGGASRK